MNLLVVTDHRYFAGPRLDASETRPDVFDHQVFDTYCFDRRFFDDYRHVFDDVRVAARIRREPLPEAAARSDGGGVRFVELTDVQGPRWVLSPPRRYMRHLRAAVSWADAVCVRIPAISAVHAARYAAAQGKPVMFELVGDPWRAVQGREHGASVRAAGLALAAATWWITRRAHVGSYVSQTHLQKRYPARPSAPTESVSSIRLQASDIRPPRRFVAAPRPIRLALVASLVPVKAHWVLIDAVAHAVHHHDVELELHLMGDGPLREQLMRQARALRVAGHIVFHGHIVGRERLYERLDDSDVFVMSSVSEGMPRAMIEAMARGLPCIGTRAGGIGELLGPREQVAIGDSRGLGELIAALAADPARLTALSKHSRTTAETFTEDVLSSRRRRLLNALRDAIASP